MLTCNTVTIGAVSSALWSVKQWLYIVDDDDGDWSDESRSGEGVRLPGFGANDCQEVVKPDTARAVSPKKVWGKKE